MKELKNKFYVNKIIWTVIMRFFTIKERLVKIQVFKEA